VGSRHLALHAHPNRRCVGSPPADPNVWESTQTVRSSALEPSIGVRCNMADTGVDADDHGWREVVALFVQAARGLAAVHNSGFVHGDAKPDNILIGSNGRVQIADLGHARRLTRDRTAWSMPKSGAKLLDSFHHSGERLHLCEGQVLSQYIWILRFSVVLAWDSAIARSSASKASRSGSPWLWSWAPSGGIMSPLPGDAVRRSACTCSGARQPDSYCAAARVGSPGCGGRGGSPGLDSPPRFG
jgi:serine/threonine protein kinase